MTITILRDMADLLRTEMPVVVAYISDRMFMGLDGWKK